MLAVTALLMTSERVPMYMVPGSALFSVKYLCPMESVKKEKGRSEVAFRQYSNYGDKKVRIEQIRNLEEWQEDK